MNRGVASRLHTEMQEDASAESAEGESPNGCRSLCGWVFAVPCSRVSKFSGNRFFGVSGFRVFGYLCGWVFVLP